MSKILEEKMRSFRLTTIPLVSLALLGGLPAPGRAAGSAPPAELSFCRPPFVHPLIITDLQGLDSDSGDPVVAIDLLDAKDSDRYSGAFETSGASELAPRHPVVSFRGKRANDGETSIEYEAYEYIGLTRSGVHVLLTWSRGGMTGFGMPLIDTRLLFLAIAEDRGITDIEMPKKGKVAIGLDRRRLLIRNLGVVHLGNLWQGTLRVAGNEVVVGQDQGRGHNNSETVILELHDSQVRPAILKPCP